MDDAEQSPEPLELAVVAAVVKSQSRHYFPLHHSTQNSHFPKCSVQELKEGLADEGVGQQCHWALPHIHSSALVRLTRGIEYEAR